MDENAAPSQSFAVLAANYRRWTSQALSLRALVVDEQLERREVARRLARLRGKRSTRGGAPRVGRRRHSREYYQATLDLVTGWPADAWQELAQALSRSGSGSPRKQNLQPQAGEKAGRADG